MNCHEIIQIVCLLLSMVSEIIHHPHICKNLYYYRFICSVMHVSSFVTAIGMYLEWINLVYCFLICFKSNFSHWMICWKCICFHSVRKSIIHRFHWYAWIWTVISSIFQYIHVQNFKSTVLWKFYPFNFQNIFLSFHINRPIRRLSFLCFN